MKSSPTVIVVQSIATVLDIFITLISGRLNRRRFLINVVPCPRSRRRLALISGWASTVSAKLDTNGSMDASIGNGLIMTSSKKKTTTRKWSRDIKTASTFPPPGTFTKPGKEIARIMASKEVSPAGLGSAIKMVQMFINRSGKKLSASRRKELEKAKKILQTGMDRQSS
jgi:Protein of unknown function (DUF3175)